MTDDRKGGADVGVVIIGRNEGERLIAGLESAAEPGRRIVYVDSGSTDGSVEAARARGAGVVALDMSVPFTAARARNAGFAALKSDGAPTFVQFIDGDCELDADWVAAARDFLMENPDVAVACGRRREKFPERTVFNRLVDREWATPVGEALACGGDALVRSEAFKAVGGYSDDLIAGEEPEFCVRLRAAGWRVWRLEAEMTRHDIAMTSLGQWLKRARRAGHAFAEVSHRHRDKPERIWARETLRAFFWTGLAVVGLVAGLALHPAFLAALLLIPAQIARMALRAGGAPADWVHAGLIMLQKPWEAAGAAQFWWKKLRGRRGGLIEYKTR